MKKELIKMGNKKDHIKNIMKMGKQNQKELIEMGNKKDHIKYILKMVK